MNKVQPDYSQLLTNLHNQSLVQLDNSQILINLLLNNQEANGKRKGKILRTTKLLPLFL